MWLDLGMAMMFRGGSLKFCQGVGPQHACSDVRRAEREVNIDLPTSSQQVFVHTGSFTFISESRVLHTERQSNVVLQSDTFVLLNRRVALSLAGVCCYVDRVSFLEAGRYMSIRRRHRPTKNPTRSLFPHTVLFPSYLPPFHRRTRL